MYMYSLLLTHHNTGIGCIETFHYKHLSTYLYNDMSEFTQQAHFMDKARHKFTIRIIVNEETNLIIYTTILPYTGKFLRHFIFTNNYFANFAQSQN